MGRFSGGDILERSRTLAVRILKLAKALPGDPASRHIALQLVRSGTSVGANLHEADMADTVRDFCNKVNIAQKEAGETYYWLAICQDAELLPAKRLRDIVQEAADIRRICRQVVLASRRNSRKKK